MWRTALSAFRWRPLLVLCFRKFQCMGYAATRAHHAGVTTFARPDSAYCMISPALRHLGLCLRSLTPQDQCAQWRQRYVRRLAMPHPWKRLRSDDSRIAGVRAGIERRITVEYLPPRTGFRQADAITMPRHRGKVQRDHHAG